MNQHIDDAPDTQRVFIALPVPLSVTDAISQAFQQYPQYIERQVPVQKWHVTLTWLGELENPHQYLSRLTKSMMQDFLPTVRLTHVGRGKKRTQLWAYVDPSVSLLSIRTQLIDRLRSFRCPLPPNIRQQVYIPHIHIADLYSVAGGVGLADYPTPVSFAAREAQVIYSTPTPKGSVYEVAGEIRLSA